MMYVKSQPEILQKIYIKVGVCGKIVEKHFHLGCQFYEKSFKYCCFVLNYITYAYA